ncbi:MAG: beta-propeller domain-containing protein [Marmoricola sp.]
MRRLTKFPARSGVAALGLGALVASGVLAAATVAGDPLAAPAVAAGSLQPFQSCAELRSWYVDTAVSQVGPYGWTSGGGHRMYPMAEAAGSDQRDAPMPSLASSGSDSAVGSSGTGTNTQETGVDEPDTAKTDGTLLVRVVEGSVVLSDVTGDQPRELSTYQLPRGMYGAELLLVGDQVVVTDTGSSPFRGGPYPLLEDGPGIDRSIPAAFPGARVVTLDVADPAHPREVSDQSYSGRLVSARQYGDVVRLVTSTDRPRLDFVYAGQHGLGTRTATARNRAIVRASSLSDWLPTVRDTDQPAAARPLVDCADVLHPVGHSGPGTVSVVGFDADRPEDRSSVAVTAGGDTVYSSTAQLYVATTEGSVGLLRGLVDRVTGHAGRPVVRTELHEFDLAGDRASYVASGSVAGTLRDRWSMDAYDGHLRLAVQTGSTDAFDDGAGRNGSNAIVTLARQGNRLVESGRVDGLGDGEEIKSVRWFESFAVVVTFRQMDPLYTVDLADPTRPALAGELKIPGFSGYLHPVGHDTLLGLGTDAGSDGRDRRALVSAFDLSDLGHPTRTGQHTFGIGTSLGAVDDPRAFTWLPGSGVGYTPLLDWSASDGRLRLVRIATDGGLTVSIRSAPGVPGDAVRVLPLPGGRMLLVAGYTATTMTP